MSKLQPILLALTSLLIITFILSACTTTTQHYALQSSLHTGAFSGEPWRTPLTIDAHEILNTKWLRIEGHTVKSPSGDKLIENWIWIDEQDQVNVLVNMKDTGKYVIARQSKYGMKTVTMATLGGLVEPGERPVEAARRELLEELGMEADQMIFLGKFRVHANRGDGHVSCFLAKGAARSRDKLESDDLEEQEWMHVTRDELVRAVLKAEFQEVKWTATVALAILHENFGREITEGIAGD